MSTRAVIARAGQTPGSWAGRYHHSDGYPHGLGKRLYDVARDMGVRRMLALLVDQHPAGWSCILECDMRKPAGYREWTREYLALEIAQQRAIDLAHGPRCFCHGDRHYDETFITHDGDDAMTEWAYAISDDAPTLGQMTVYKRRYDPYRWDLVAMVDLLGEDEPDWQAMEGEQRDTWALFTSPLPMPEDPKVTRRVARERAKRDQAAIDEYLYTRDVESQELFAWRLEARYGHAKQAAARLADYQRAKARMEALTAIIRERDLWKPMSRRDRWQRQHEQPLVPPPTPDAA